MEARLFHEVGRRHDVGKYAVLGRVQEGACSSPDVTQLENLGPAL